MDTSIKITVRMMKQQINKEQIRVYLIGLDKEQQSQGVCLMSQIPNLFEASFLFLGLLSTSAESSGAIGSSLHAAAAPCLSS